MPIKSKAYPFPVLQPDFKTYSAEDMFEVEFQLTIDLVDDVAVQTLFPRVKLTNVALEELLANGSVGVYAEIYVPATYQRELIEISLGGKEILLSDLDLTGAVELTGVIISKTPIDSFLPTGVINEFGKVKSGFSVKKSDVLAYTYTEVFEIGMDHEVRPDFLRIQPVPDAAEYWFDFNVDGPVISILLSQKMMSFWVAHKQDKAKKSSLFTNVYRECITRAIEEIQSNPDLEYPWAKTLQNECARRGIDLAERNAFEVSSELLFDKGFGSILKWEEKAND
jgi:hypothetical protein